MDFSLFECFVSVDAIKSVKTEYRVKKNWQGDPCVPIEYMWDGLNCTYNQDDLPRITSLYVWLLLYVVYICYMYLFY